MIEFLETCIPPIVILFLFTTLIVAPLFLVIGAIGRWQAKKSQPVCCVRETCKRWHSANCSADENEVRICNSYQSRD